MTLVTKLYSCLKEHRFGGGPSGALHSARSHAGMPVYILRRVLTSALLVLLTAGVGTGCNGTRSATSTPPPEAVSVSISPAFTELRKGASKSFSATVNNAKDTSVTWSIKEGSAGGEITSDGVYTASGLDGQYHIVATANEDTAKSATATVTVVAGVFTPTGSLTYRRSGHTATLLPNGQVLIAGGFDWDAGFADYPELYDPAAGTFSQLDWTMHRIGHTATRLVNGDVLFAGGEVDYGTNLPATDSAQILKADTGLIEATGSMVTARAYHAATLLQDGRVLITGGTGSGTRTATTEIYDPSSGTFSPVTSMKQAHANHSAILLSSGKVLITGDSGESELYDPATDMFTVTASQPAHRQDVTVTSLADGKVLLTGGDVDDNTDMYLGPSNIFDPVTEQFTTTGALITKRFLHTATLLADGTVLIAGGESYYSNSGGYATWTTRTEIYEPATGAVRPGPAMWDVRVMHTATLLPDGSVLLVGGWIGPGSSTAEIYK